MEKQITVLNKNISLLKENKDNYINLIDIARHKNPEISRNTVMNWIRTRSTVEFLGVWEKLNNSKFNVFEFEHIKNKSGSNAFYLSPSKWIETTNAVGIIAKLGKFGGVYAHEDIALEFASWISPEFKLYLVKEFRRLKEKENKQESLEWNVKRTLTKINYRIHTDAIKENLIPIEISKEQARQVYANEGDLLNVALFGKTAQEWRLNNKDKKGNIRDYSDVSQLVCLANLENLNASYIEEKIDQSTRLIKLNKTAIRQMKLLVKDKDVKKLSLNK